MNMNPWLIQSLVEYERERIRQDMKQIRLEEEAIQAGCTEEQTTKARLYRPRLPMSIVCILAKLRLLRMNTRKTWRYSGNTGPCRG